MDVMLFLRHPNFSRFAAIKNPIFKWIRRWHRPGAFELNIPYNAGIDDNVLLSKGIECGVVDGIVIETTESDGDQMTVSGSFLAGYADRRIVWGTQTISDTPEEVLRQLVLRNMGADADADRQFEGLTVQDAQGFAGDVIDYQNADTPLLEELYEISRDSGLGYDIVLNGLGMKFRVLQGLDRTAGQAANPRAIFSIRRNNLLSAEFERDSQKYTNVAKISNELYTEVFGTATGYARREAFIKPSSVEKDDEGNVNDESTQRALMQQQGEQGLTQMTLSLVVRIDPNGNLKYKEHYDLGDICTCSVARWGVSIDARLTEVKEIYAEDGFGLECTFGTGQLTYGQNIRRIANA